MANPRRGTKNGGFNLQEMSLEHVENHPFNGVNVKVKKILFSDICSLGEEKQSSNLMIITVANERNNYFIPR